MFKELKYQVCDGWKLRAVRASFWIDTWQVELSGNLPYKGMGRYYEPEFEKEHPDGLVPVHLTFTVDDSYHKKWELTGGDYVLRGRWVMICISDFAKQVPEEVRRAAFNVLLTLPEHMQPPKHMHP